MTNARLLLALGARLDKALDDVRELKSEMGRAHAVYPTAAMNRAVDALADARNGLAKSIGHAVLNEQRAKP